MEPSLPIEFPRASFDPLAFDLHEIEAAIELVARGAATSVTIVGLRRPEVVAGSGVVLAQHADVAFSLERDGDGRPTVCVTRIDRAPSARGDAPG
ncbi:MAG: hypothetical protein ACRDF7_10620 [Candidatus Limnocylindrales bacterium]